MDHDARVYHVKKHRTQYASALACSVSLLVGVGHFLLSASSSKLSKCSSGTNIE